jgi:hypothetical protein
LNLSVERFFLGAGSEGHGTIADISGTPKNEEFRLRRQEVSSNDWVWKGIADCRRFDWSGDDASDGEGSDRPVRSLLVTRFG